MFATSIASLYSALSEMAANIQFIEEKLPSHAIPPSERSQVESVCSEFRGALYDVRKEVRNFEDKLGMHPGEEPFDPEIQNPDPKVTMGFISNWLREPIEQMHVTVMRLQKASESDFNSGGAYLLVAESAVNVLNAYSSIENSLADIAARVEKKGV